ncbi:uncharacterized protein TNCV_1086391 [Trichonephila clavipes]|nr:uncharacterized protein TNCV_1086391 [Trichonephila clavipes]
MNGEFINFTLRISTKIIGSRDLGISWGCAPFSPNFNAPHNNSINLKYEAISVPQDSVRLVKKTQERKSFTCYLLIPKNVTSSSPVPLKIRRVGERCTLNLSKAQKSSCWNGVVVKRGQLKYRPRHLTMVQNYEDRLQKLLCS